MRLAPVEGLIAGPPSPCTTTLASTSHSSLTLPPASDVNAFMDGEAGSPSSSFQEPEPPSSSLPASSQSSGSAGELKLVECAVMWEDMIDAVDERHRDMMSIEEYSWLRFYYNSTRQAQQVFCALLSLPNTWHRMEEVEHEVTLDPAKPHNTVAAAFKDLARPRPIEPPHDLTLSQLSQLSQSQLSQASQDSQASQQTTQPSQQSLPSHSTQQESSQRVKDEPVDAYLPPPPQNSPSISRRPLASLTNYAATPPSVKEEDYGDSVDCSSLAFGFRYTERKVKLEALTTEQLKDVYRQILGKRKIKSREQMIDDLEKTSRQSTLPFTSIKKEDAEFGTQTTKRVTQFDRMMLLVDKYVEDVPCIKIKPEVYEFFRLVNVLAYRRTTYPDFSRPESPLHDYTVVKQTTFCQRDHRIWPSRADLDRYYDALVLKARVEGNLPWPATKVLRPQPKCSKPKFSARFLKPEDSQQYRTAAQCHLALVKEAMEGVKGELEQLHAASESLGDEPPRLTGLRRFEQGYILTRVLWTGAQALAKSRADKDKMTAIALYEKVLKQDRWCLGDSGAIYDEYIKLLLDVAAKAPKDEACTLRERAITAVVTALDCHDVGISHRPRLRRYRATLAKVMGHLDGAIDVLPTIKPETIHLVKHVADVEDSCASQGPKGREGVLHLWSSADMADEPASALECVARRYEAKGYTVIRNRHLLTSIFALLFWDILWDEDVPGAFEYCYQDGPLDLYEPAVFLRSRERQICELLKDIGDGEGAVVVDRNLRSSEDGSAKPMTVGWDHINYSPDDPATLMKVVQEIQAGVLVTIGTLFCEDYIARRNSVPDLVVHDDHDGGVKFVYVTDGKALTPAQQVWIDTLLSANAQVEYCKVVEEPRSPRRPTKKRKRQASKPKANATSDAEEDDEDAPQEASDVEGSYESGQVDSAGPSSQLRRTSCPRVAKRRRSEEDEDM
ncbi:hypothetical protein EV715DRAFT_197835 [Schizophyllum commune]